MNEYIVRGYQGNPYVSDLSNATLLWEEKVAADTDYDAHLIATHKHGDNYGFTNVSELDELSDDEKKEFEAFYWQEVCEAFHQLKLWIEGGDQWYTPPGGEAEDRIYMDREYALSLLTWLEP